MTDQPSVLTDQEIFDRCARHLIRQGRPATITNSIGGTMCLYLTPDGDRCAVGGFFRRTPEIDALAPKISGSFGAASSNGTAVSLIDLLDFVPINEQTQLLRVLQSTHDRWSSRDDWAIKWRLEMRDVARTWKLSTAVLDEPAPLPQQNDQEAP